MAKKKELIEEEEVESEVAEDKARLSVLDFCKIWQTSSNVAEVVRRIKEEFGIEIRPEAVHARAMSYRTRGIQIRKMQRGRHYDTDEINAELKKLGLASTVTGGSGKN